MKENILKMYRRGYNHREITAMMYSVEKAKDRHVRFDDIDRKVIKVILEAHKRKD